MQTFFKTFLIIITTLQILYITNMKSFTNSFLNDFKILKKAVIGLEFEFYSKLNYPSTLEHFNRNLTGIDVLGFKQYHSDFKPTNKEFKLEPDMSGGFNMAELVTGPMTYSEAKLVSTQILKVIQEIGYTTDRSGIHINISFPEETGKNIEQLNILKLILNIEENKIYDAFPGRRNNIYAKSIKNIIPFKDYDYTGSTINVLNNSVLLPKTKYYGVNFSTMVDGRLEFRYVGGEDYQFKINEILELVDYFVKLVCESLAVPLEPSETKALRTYLDENIRSYKSLSKVENFTAQYPTVELQVDKQTDFEILKSYYPRLYPKLYDIVTKIGKIDNCIINYDTERKNLEIVNANIEVKDLISNVFFVNSTIKNGDFLTCIFKECDITNTIINSSEINESHIEDSKLLECHVNNNSKIINSYFAEGFLDGMMQGGVFRSGKMGENAQISKETKLFNNNDNFFNIKMGRDIEQSDKKKGFGKKK